MKDFNFKIDGQDYTASVEELENGAVEVTVNGKKYQVEVPELAAAAPKAVLHAPIAGAPAAAPRAAQAGGVSKISSPLPGTITKVNATAGQKVKKGDVLVVMEAMKMQNDIVAEADGTVLKVIASVGQSVNQGDALIEFQSDALAAAPAPAPVQAPKAAPAAPASAPKAAAPAAGAKTVNAPLPGTVSKINVQAGQQVKAGETVLVMEAMKMANDITSEWDGTVKAVLVQQGAQVQAGDALIELA